MVKIVLCLGFVSSEFLSAQTQTNAILPNVAPVPFESTNAVSATPPAGAVEATNAPPVSPISLTPAPAAAPEQLSPLVVKPPSVTVTDSIAESGTGEEPRTDWMILAALMTMASLGGFMLYQCGLTRAKNCGHTSTLLLVGAIFGLIGYWIGGFAVQTGGEGDAHAALARSLMPAERSALDHELGFMAFGHHWGLMGSSGFFLMTDETARNGTAALFLGQGALLVIAVAAALGAALERGRLLAMAICAFLIGVFIYPLMANWVWGGGWLAQLGRAYGLGHGFVDLGGAGVVHETAGTLALVIAMVLGPRQDRFGRNKLSMPGHNVPFFIFGALILLFSWTATNAFAYVNPVEGSNAGLAAVNTLLASAGGLLSSFFLAAGQRRQPEPALLCRGLLGGAVASCGCSALIDPWAAFVIGAVAGLVVQVKIGYLERRRIDDPSGAFATHGAAGGWGVLATGLFANGVAGRGFNGVDGPVRGLFFGGAWHQLAAQAIGAATGFVVVFILGYACLSLIQKILGNRVDAMAEADGLDWSETGALGYQGDVSPEDASPKAEEVA